MRPARAAAALRPPTLLALALLAALPACAYLRHRVKDASESVHVGLGASLVPGVLAYAYAPVLGTSVGFLDDSTYVGSDYGYVFGWHQAGRGVGVGGELVRTGFGHELDGWRRGGALDAYLLQSQYFLLDVSIVDHRTDISRTSLALTRFEVGLHLLVVGASVGVDPVELLDFVTGLVGLDLLADDDFVPEYAPFGDEPRAVGEEADTAPPAVGR